MHETEQSRKPLALLGFYLRGHERALFGALLFALVSQIFLMIDPLILRHVLDHYVLRRSDFSPQGFLLRVIFWLTLILAAALIAWIARGFQTQSVCSLAQRVSTQIYSDGMSHSLEISYAELEQRRSGDTMSQLQRTRREVELFLTSAVNVLFTSLVGLAFIIIYASRLHWSVPLFLLVTAPMVMFFSILLSRKVRSTQEEIVKQSSVLAGSAGESLKNMELVKSLGLTGNEVSRFRTGSARILELELRRIRQARIYSFFHGAGVHIVRVSLFLLLLYLFSVGKGTVGQFFSLFLYSYFILGPMQDLGNVISQYRELEASLIAFGELMDHPKESRPVEPVSISVLDTLEFDGVSFSYGPTGCGHGPAAQAISFRASRGETIAFVGQSGAGKSTIIKLLSGLYSPSEGRILFNGVSSSEVDWNCLRNYTGLVTQETHLFSGTIRDNLIFAAPDATEDECLTALQQAAVTSLLERGRDGLNSRVGEGGLQLSGGERQRLAIARALLRRPQLILFDEATSALDSITEQAIGGTIRNLATANQIITIVISHRLATVIRADRIYVLAKGRIVESGTHEALLASDGLYCDMWQRQSGSFAGSTETQVGGNISYQ
ncbi:ATP-binding cassette subfamily B protein [Granulicella aggregans]|uniref:ATP-binding cassette subfamily B protein n=1 Tax=Granulicella aggregans TaxID=474949 RepID=A0A7W7ZGX3_9BACT|nr:ABC transporter ATP-binding protein [Granulicella aggregans]MBB5059622.1 ATP-binding cassette subfamily B protein [Granulicella aggregans]